MTRGFSVSDGAHVPVFPLPDYVLFPHTEAAFHIFEPRYREMTGHCLENDGLLVVAGLRPGWRRDYYGSPPVYSVAGLGRVTRHTRLPDGRYHLIVEGITRVELRRFEQMAPFRVAEVALLRDRSVAGEVDATAALRERICAMVRKLCAMVNSRSLEWSHSLDSTTEFSCFVDRVTAMTCTEPAERQQLLEELCPVARARRLSDSLAALLLRASSQEDSARGAGGEPWVH